METASIGTLAGIMGGMLAMPGPLAATWMSLRAFDKDTGYEVFEMELPARSSAAPITYLADGVQYIVIAVGGGDSTEQLVALALP